MSVLFVIIYRLKQPILNSIQVLYCNLICTITLGFIYTIELAEKDIMDIPLKCASKYLVGHFLFLRITLSTIILVTYTIVAVFIATAIKSYPISIQYFLASNTLTCSTYSITLSTHFVYNSIVHLYTFMGNKVAVYSIIITVELQLFITYVLSLNTIIFTMD